MLKQTQHEFTLNGGWQVNVLLQCARELQALLRPHGSVMLQRPHLRTDSEAGGCEGTHTRSTLSASLPLRMQLLQAE